MHSCRIKFRNSYVARHACEVNDDGSSTSKVSSKTNGRPKNGKVIRESHGGTDLAATTTRTLCSAYKRQHRSRMVGKLP